MTTINPYSSTYAPGLTAGQTATQRANQATGYGAPRDQSPTINTPAVNVTLSAAAQAALKAQTDSRTIETVVSEAKAQITARLKAAGTKDALKGGDPSIDLTSLDRRTLYAVASNKGGAFPMEQQVVASLALKSQADQTLAAPAAQARLTGDYASLYQTALNRLDAAGPEEKETAAWSQQREALVEGRKQAIARPGIAPAGIANDTVAAYMSETGSAVAGAKTREFGKVATDVRAALDKQYELAVSPGMATDADSGEIDFRRFDDRSLSAIALNKDEQFSGHEINKAKAEIRRRDSAAIKAGYQSSSDEGSAGFGMAMITRYAGMTVEERDATGWTPALYSKMVELQTASDKLAELFNANGALAGPPSMLDFL
ncbi:hypothetical protein [Caulobacter sp. RHG1]|uniref:hypothetical protein n=1 Tax=Caulobacter sp. (strain RHG1) TaxID=2545762 RepID=UPI001556A0A0|nr:hypothetical protein [Caulobacter sp. RHG1]NQE61082.1 hypothetical protein [Caulobacter sp. RHG1]